MTLYRYWRVWISASQAGGNIAIGEIGMRASFGGANQCVLGAPLANVAQAGHPAADAYDGSSATAWASNNTIPAWIGYDFGVLNPVDVVELAITSWTDATFWSLAPKDFTVQASGDGFATISQVYSAVGVVWTGPGQTKLFNVGAQALEATKAVTYSAVGPPLLISCTKAVMYVITGPDNGARQRIKVRYLRGHR